MGITIKTKINQKQSQMSLFALVNNMAWFTATAETAFIITVTNRGNYNTKTNNIGPNLTFDSLSSLQQQFQSIVTTMDVNNDTNIDITNSNDQQVPHPNNEFQQLHYIPTIIVLITIPINNDHNR